MPDVVLNPPLLRIEDGEGRFGWGRERDALFDRYYAVLEAAETADAGPAAMRAAHLGILLEDPYFIDAHNALGAEAFESGDYEEALAHYVRARGVGEAVVPRAFRGRLIWGWMENRPFLRALYGCASALLRLDRGAEAAALLRRLLRYNPADNQGARHLLGEAYLRAGDLVRVERAMRRQLARRDEVVYPGVRYLYALVLAEQGRLVEAATHFRRGLVENVYLAEMLTGKRPLLPYAIGVFNGSFGGPDTAYEHVESCLRLWVRHPSGLAMLSELFRHPDVGEEVEGVYHLRVQHARIEGLTEAAILRRFALQRQIDALLARIDDASSRALLRDVERYAKEVSRDDLRAE